MVSVATSIDAPIKILFPKSKYLFLNNSHGFALLGGGDIVVPGLWCGLCLRYDWYAPPSFPFSSLSCPFVLTRVRVWCARPKVTVAARSKARTAAARTTPIAGIRQAVLLHLARRVLPRTWRDNRRDAMVQSRPAGAAVHQVRLAPLPVCVSLSYVLFTLL